MSSFRRFLAEHPLPFFVLQADYIRRFFFILFIAGGCYPPLFLLFQADCIRRSLFAISLFLCLCPLGGCLPPKGVYRFFSYKNSQKHHFFAPRNLHISKFFRTFAPDL